MPSMTISKTSSATCSAENLALLVLGGSECTRDIEQRLEMSSIILLLVSPDFLASDYCYV